MATPEHPTAGAPSARRGGGGTGSTWFRARALAGSCHPGPTAAVTVLLTVLARAAGHNAVSTALIAAAVLTGQLSVGWCNDAFDARRDIAAGRRDKPIAAGAVGVRTVWTAAWCALALCVPLSLACGPLAGTVHLAGVAAAWAYDLRLKSTAWSWLPYAAGFASLPAFVALSLPGHPWPAWWLVCAGALLGVGAHLGDVLPDIRDDLAAGVRGWPQRLGTSATRLLLPLPLVAATALLVLGPPGPPGARSAAALLAAVLVAVAGSVVGRQWERAAFAAAVVVAALDVALLVGRGAAII
ncbi:UbiA family prenyltransferase [Streptomyces sp. SID13666]|uniref:UbiA family prenyltransferase n=1 Tax=unclassified Streptomyces TaxID=2593676 RepID=UPI0013C26EBA|nr:MULTISPECIES: UbiA family prenyltransferase [unclassified Streptomyces]NEA52798.1 UbiA family prenyltransferase [Streptomyces sp. SID13666]NEA69875.1 UbiA family prenyltransferase [Streptomyces sp. SID13588]